MFQMMLKRIPMAHGQKAQLKSLCAACFGCAANLSIRNIALYIYYSKILDNNAILRWRETVVSLPDINGVFWLCCAAFWIVSISYVVKPLSPKPRDAFRLGFCRESLCSRELFSAPGMCELGDTIPAAVKMLQPISSSFLCNSPWQRRTIK